jgi:hypothetical protein
MGPALRRNSSEAKLGKMDEIDQNGMMRVVRARVRARVMGSYWNV